MTDGKGVDKVVIAGGGCETFESAVKCLKPGGKIGNVNYLGSGAYVTVPRVEWGVGMGHKLANWMYTLWLPMYLKDGIIWKRRCL